jgi:hypothetical protein
MLEALARPENFLHLALARRYTIIIIIINNKETFKYQKRWKFYKW